MFEEGQLYAPVTAGADGAVEVQLGDDHPGVDDPVYRAAATPSPRSPLAWRPGEPSRTRTTPTRSTRSGAVGRELAVLHQRSRAPSTSRARDRAPAPRPTTSPSSTRSPAGLRAADRLPLRPRRRPGAAARLLRLPRRRRSSTPRSTSGTTRVPLYTPEPDVIHEVVGHANCLAHPRFAALYRSAGEAARRVETTQALEFVSKVFWFSLEFGVCARRAWCAPTAPACSSSYGEIQEFARADLRPLDIARMGVQTYDITHYQPLLFCAESFDEIEDVVGGFFDTVDDELVAASLRQLVSTSLVRRVDDHGSGRSRSVCGPR